MRIINTQEEYESFIAEWNSLKLDDFIPYCDSVVDLLKRRTKKSIPGKMHKTWKCRSKHALLKHMIIYAFKYIINRIVENGDIFQLTSNCRIQSYYYEYISDDGVIKGFVTPLIICGKHKSMMILSKKQFKKLNDNYKSGKIFVPKIVRNEYGAIHI